MWAYQVFSLHIFLPIVAMKTDVIKETESNSFLVPDSLYENFSPYSHKVTTNQIHPREIYASPAATGDGDI